MQLFSVISFEYPALFLTVNGTIKSVTRIKKELYYMWQIKYVHVIKDDLWVYIPVKCIFICKCKQFGWYSRKVTNFSQFNSGMLVNCFMEHHFVFIIHYIWIAVIR